MCNYSKCMAFAGWICDTRKLGAISTKILMSSVATLSATTMGMFSSIGAVST